MLACARLTRSPQAFRVSGCPSATILRPSALTFLAAFQSRMWRVRHPAGPLPVGERKVVVLVSAFGPQLGRWKESTDLDEVLAVPQGFVLYLAEQFTECSI